MKPIILFLFLIIISSSKAQSNVRRFFELSAPLKKWVITHPFKAKKALLISEEAKRISDSLKNTGLLLGKGSGQQIDAFRHAYWMARLHQEIGKSAAKSLGKAYEKADYKLYKKNKLEDGFLPDEIASKMDLWNNDVGLSLVSKKPKISRKGVLFRVVNAIKNGSMKVIKIDKNGNYLDCSGEIIPKEKLEGKWKNNKCLISSNELI